MVRLAVERLCTGELLLDQAGSRYLVSVHRLCPTDTFVAFDPAVRLEADGVIVAVAGGRVRVRLGEARAATRVTRHQWVVVQCAAKGDKLAQIVRQATELGATEVMVAATARSLRRPTGQQLLRWRRIALHAARQCGRGDVPQITEPAPLSEVLTAVAARPGQWCRLLLDPHADRMLGAAVRALALREAAVIVIGPEGGLTPDEHRHATALGFEAVRLGRFVARTETVCAAALGALWALRDAG